MNKIIKIMLAAMGLILFWSCEKNDEVITATPGGTPTLAASATVLELEADDTDQKAVTFDWDEVSVTWSNNDVAIPIINYTLQISRQGNNFQNILFSKDTEEIAADIMVGELNAALLAAQAVGGEPIALEVRLRVTIAANRVEYTNVIALTVTPYDDYVMLPSLWIAGSLNGWSHSDDYRIASLHSDEHYEGYIYFGNDDTAFKFCSQPDWEGTNYGDGGGSDLDTDGGAGNLTLPSPGYYLLKANTDALTWSATEVTWGLIGDAVGGWGDDDDIVMTYDAGTRLWTATVTMSAGPWKFRANGGWNLNLGAGSGEGKLVYGGGDFQQEAGGTYLITLDLSDPGNYTYTMEQQ